MHVFPSGYGCLPYKSVNYITLNFKNNVKIYHVIYHGGTEWVKGIAATFF
jgi:hypothetical protein